MSLKGSLESFSFTNILQMISLEKKTGLLEVEHKDISISVAFRDGLVIFAERKGTKDLDRLKYTLAVNKLLPKDRVLHSFKESQATMEPVWTILSKFAPTEILKELLERQIKDCLFLALQWETGTYRFDLAKELDVPEHIGVVVGIDSILMEGCRIADEWRVLAKNFPGGETIVKRAENIKSVKTSNEKLILTYLREETKLDLLINLSRLGEFETCEAINALLKRGSILVVSEARKPKAEAEPLEVRLKKAAGMLAPALALAFVLFGIFGQAGRMEDALSGFGKEMDYIHKEESRAHLDFLFSRLQLYTALYGEYPKNLRQLAQTGLLSERESLDHWGRPVQYFIRNDRFFLYSSGRGGNPAVPEVVFGE